MIDSTCLVDLLKVNVNPDQLRNIVNDASTANYNYHCIVCGEDDVCVNNAGDIVPPEHPEAIRQERHNEHCPLGLIEEYLGGNNV